MIRPVATGNPSQMQLHPEQQAPSLRLKNADGQTVSLGDFRGQWIVVYFYPKDNTAGCTLEANTFNTSLEEFASQNAIVVGVSPDSCQSHQRFSEKYGLNFTLLSDPEHHTLESWGVWQEKKLYGKKYMGVVRSTFLIDPEGTVAVAWTNVRVKHHVPEVLEELKRLRSIA